MSENRKMLEKIISKFLRVQRNVKDLTQYELADLAGIKRSNYASYELHGRISLDNFVLVMSALNADYSDFSTYVEEWKKEIKASEAKRKNDEIMKKIAEDLEYE